jgi:hypothetical protein
MAFPADHQKHIMTTNLLERAFGEQRRRTKIIPRFSDEKSCLKPVYATMVGGKDKVAMSENERLWAGAPEKHQEAIQVGREWGWIHIQESRGIIIFNFTWDLLLDQRVLKLSINSVCS